MTTLAEARTSLEALKNSDYLFERSDNFYYTSGRKAEMNRLIYDATQIVETLENEEQTSKD